MSDGVIGNATAAANAEDDETQERFLENNIDGRQQGIDGMKLSNRVNNSSLDFDNALKVILATATAGIAGAITVSSQNLVRHSDDRACATCGTHHGGSNQQPSSSINDTLSRLTSAVTDLQKALQSQQVAPKVS